MISLIGAAFVAGLVGSPHCVGMCGTLAVAASGTAREATAWNLGRMLTYAVLGAVAGAVGQSIPGPGWVLPAVAAVFLGWFAWRLAGFSTPKSMEWPAFTRLTAKVASRHGVGPRLAFGMLTGLLPCGLVYAALALPLSSGDPVAGSATMAAFGLGTAPILVVAGAGLRRVVARSLLARRILAATVLLIGLFSLVNRANRDPSTHGHDQAPTDPVPSGEHQGHGGQ